LGLTLVGILITQNFYYSKILLLNALLMGLLGALGNYFIIKALSYGDLSSLAPINSYKPVVALILGIFLLQEYPTCQDLLGFLFITIGTFILSKSKMFFSKATFYRVIALILLGSEAIFIKKVILISNINTAFLYWALMGFIFTMIFSLISKHSYRLRKSNIKYQILLIIMVATMQYSTNYIFEKMNVAYALALFQLSSIVSVFLGANIFKEEGLQRKLIASIIMLIGACIIILNNT